MRVLRILEHAIVEKANEGFCHINEDLYMWHIEDRVLSFQRLRISIEDEGFRVWRQNNFPRYVDPPGIVSYRWNHDTPIECFIADVSDFVGGQDEDEANGWVRFRESVSEVLLQSKDWSPSR